MAENQTQVAAGAVAAMCERTARKWQAGALPSETKEPRAWRTRSDPFSVVWSTEVLPLLLTDEKGEFDATTILEELRRRHGDQYGPDRLRTLQRRMHEWRALHGIGKEVMFEQVHEAGREGAFDFTECDELGVTIAGAPFPHLLFQLILSFSKWRFVCLAFSETFEAMLHGLQSALWTLKGAPRVLRSDNLSAATHQLPGGGRELTRRYKEILDHYGLTSTRIEPGESHQNGGAEKAHHVLKSNLRQALLLRASGDFASVALYESFVAEHVDRLNCGKPTERLVEERAHLRPLPSKPLPEYTVYTATVRQWSTIHFARRVYSVPSRLIDCEVEVRQHADIVEIYYRDKLTETMPRIRGERSHRIDYRHMIWSLARKPGAFARYRFREELFPSITFRRAYDALVEARGVRADVEYVRVLHLAASTLQTRVEEALMLLIACGDVPDFAAVKALCAPEKSPVPVIHIPPPDLAPYSRLLTGGGA